MKRLFLALALTSVAPAALAAPQMEVLLAPGPLAADAEQGHLDVTLKLSGVDAAAGQPLLALPVVIANTATVATTLQNLRAVDAAGEVPLTFKDDPVAIAYARHWIPGRAVKGDLTVSYRAPIDNTPPKRGSGPPYQLRTEGGGLSGVGNTFVLIPEGQQAYDISLRWDLSQLPGSAATSSFGDGDVSLGVGPAGRLMSTVFMAGPMHRYPQVPKGGFSAVWLGTPPFDPAPVMDWTHQLHTWMIKFFRDPSEPPYRVFLRYNPINAGGGAALTNSFLTTYGKTGSGEALKGTLAHEMIHTWTSVDGPGQWFGEGNAVFYQALLPMRAGLITPDDYLADLNETARRYYSNPLNDTPNDQIAPRFWEDTRVRVLPYDRGAMYFAVLDGQIRKASGGKRSVDDLVIEMVERNRRGQTTGEADWLALLDKELGAAGAKTHAAMLAGGLMLPEVDGFGPCFTRTIGKVRRFELGFEPKSLVGDVKTIRDLQPTSEAAKAGLRNGDVVTYGQALDALQGDPQLQLTLQVTRDGKTFPISYLPRAEEVEIYQWKRVPGVPDTACGRGA
ncbi:MAG: peptidase M61 [Phenylobacterium sp.]|uniref:M61 family metallopeptidase n=1 Tax=Phenylobacterium sp. TaxID=1871053 RepID=UPI0025F47D72|nr:hypothetical protein [Phenylobacterium sp.]MBA4010442.1 peptidase M61 [Phenylobacterium sp.]